MIDLCLYRDSTEGAPSASESAWSIVGIVGIVRWSVRDMGERGF